MSFKLVCLNCKGLGEMPLVKGFRWNKKCKRCSGKGNIMEGRSQHSLHRISKDLRS